MLKWFRRPGAPKVGPDFRNIDTRGKAEHLFARGQLQKLYLLPFEFGGEDIPANVVYVPPFAFELKRRLDQNTIRPLAQQGRIRRYSATPQYEGQSVVPGALRIVATEPGRFEGTIAIWGAAVQPKPAAAPALQSVFSLAPKPLEGLDPAAFVRAYIAEYERWNAFANEASAWNSSSSREAIEVAYGTLVAKFCPPGHVHQPVAFGSDCSHDNRREVLLGTEAGPDSCVVRTRFTKLVGKSTLTHDYEYHLQQGPGRWLLTSVLFVDTDGKYEGL